jgi:hypothetical protein
VEAGETEREMCNVTRRVDCEGIACRATALVRTPEGYECMRVCGRRFGVVRCEGACLFCRGKGLFSSVELQEDGGQRLVEGGLLGIGV